MQSSKNIPQKVNEQFTQINNIGLQVLEKDFDGFIFKAKGLVVPSGASFAKGCTFLKIDTDNNSNPLYYNYGDIANANFIDLSVATKIFNVKNYGAKGDGVTDDTAAITAAITAASNAGGGRVYLPDGVFYGGIQMISSANITLEGNGPSTIYKLKNGINPTNGIINFTGTQTYNWRIKNLIIDGNKANNSSGDGIYMNTNLDISDSRQIIEEVEVRNCQRHGFNLQQGGQTSMLKSRATNNNGYGFYLNASDGVFTDLIADTNLLSGIYANCFAAHYKDCKAYYNANGNAFDAGIYIKAYNSYFVQCEAEDNYYHGIVIDGAAHGCILNNCIGDSNGQTLGNGLVIYGNNNIVSGGIYYERDFPPVWTQSIGILLAGTATGNIITGAILYSNTTQYSDTSSGTNYHIATAPAILATGTGKTVDNVITALQNLGLVKQS